MTDEEVNQEILDNLSRYVLIKASKGYLLFSIERQSYLITEDNGEFNDLLLQKGIRVVNSVEEVRNPNFVHRCQVWDEDQQKMLMLSHDEIMEFFKKKNDRRNRKILDIIKNAGANHSTSFTEIETEVRNADPDIIRRGILRKRLRQLISEGHIIIDSDRGDYFKLTEQGLHYLENHPTI